MFLKNLFGLTIQALFNSMTFNYGLFNDSIHLTNKSKFLAIRKIFFVGLPTNKVENDLLLNQLHMGAYLKQKGE
jgi:hypothetical protein